MILKASQRGHADALASHLLNERENDHVEVAELRHFAVQNLHGAFREIAATANGTRCKQPFFQVIVNPPGQADLSPGQFEQVFAAIEQKYPALKDQPRAIVFHEKNGRRHAHAIWSRIDGDRMRAINLSHTKIKMRDVARAMCREFGIKIPAGMEDKAKRDPLNFDRPTWQQAKRLDEDPRELKALITEAFRYSDSAKAFAANLEQHGMMLARGDKRGFVIVHHTGEALPLHRFLGLKIGETKARLGDPAQLMSADQARAMLRDRMAAQADRQFSDLKNRHDRERRPIMSAVADLRQAHRDERTALYGAQGARQAKEAMQRAQRLRSGLHGLWQRFTGERGRIVRQNAAEAKAADRRDLAERHEIVTRQLAQRRELQAQLRALDGRHSREREQARAELGHWLAQGREGLREQFREGGREIEQQAPAHDDERGTASSAFERQAEPMKLSERVRRDREAHEREEQGRGREGPGREREP